MAKKPKIKTEKEMKDAMKMEIGNLQCKLDNANKTISAIKRNYDFANQEQMIKGFQKALEQALLYGDNLGTAMKKTEGAGQGAQAFGRLHAYLEARIDAMKVELDERQ